MPYGNNRPSITLVVAARPNFTKALPLLDSLETWADVDLVHTGQHYDPAMSASFIAELGLRPPDVNLGVGSGSLGHQTGRVLIELDRRFRERRPDLVLVVGDVNSTLAGALAAAQMGIDVAHVEAGLRSGDWSMPEELNRVLTDRLSRWLFTPSPDADANLAAEGIEKERIHRVGNVMIDTLLRLLPKARERSTAAVLGCPSPYGVVTLHRPSNVDDPDSLRRTLEMLQVAAAHLPLVFPVHPRFEARIQELGQGLPDGVLAVEPLGYLDFLSLVDSANVVITDSGGIQEETSVLGVPCLTVRETTERPITVQEGTNRLVGRDPERISTALVAALEEARSPAGIDLWDGKASHRIAEVLAADLET